MTHARRRLTLLLAVALSVAACTPPPVTLSPQAKVAFNNTRVIKSLDLIRDTAQAANAQDPPLVSTDAARAVTTWHRSALRVIEASGANWQAAVSASMAEVYRNLPPAEQRLLLPYFTLAKTIFDEVSQ